MNLLLRRNQRQALMGKAIFSLDIRAEISTEEQQLIKKYKLGDTELYSSHTIVDRGSGLIGAATRLAWKAITLTITVNDLANGKRVECKDIVEMLATEDHIREAAQTFGQVLSAAANFGGEEVVAI